MMTETSTTRFVMIKNKGDDGTSDAEVLKFNIFRCHRRFQASPKWQPKRYQNISTSKKIMGFLQRRMRW